MKSRTFGLAAKIGQPESVGDQGLNPQLHRTQAFQLESDNRV